MSRELVCNACGGTTHLTEGAIKRVEIIAFDNARIWVSYLECEVCKIGYPFAYDSKDTLRQGAAGAFMRSILFKRYAGKAYQIADPNVQLELFVPGRNTPEEDAHA